MRHGQTKAGGWRRKATAARAPADPQKPVLIPATAKILSARQVRGLLGGKSEMFIY
jgi:hypothetical protein